MRRLARMLLNMASVLSLLLCVAAVMLCVRGRWLEEQVFFARPAGRMWLFRSASDGLSCHVAQGWTGRRDWGYEWLAKGDSGSAPNIHLRPYLFPSINSSDTITRWPLGIATSREQVFVGLAGDGAALSFAGYYTQYLRSAASPSRDMPVRGIFVPYWLLVVVTGLLPAGRLGWWRRRAAVRRSRLRRGACPACGYDCRATPERCPECGTAFPEPHPVPKRGAE